MSIKITVSELQKAVPHLTELYQAKFPLQTSYRVGRICNFVDAELKEIALKRQEIMQPYLLQSDDPQQPLALPVDNQEAMAELTAKMQELDAMEVEIGWNPLTVEELGSREFSPAAADALSKFILFDSQPAHSLDKTGH